MQASSGGNMGSGDNTPSAGRSCRYRHLAGARAGTRQFGDLWVTRGASVKRAPWRASEGKRPPGLAEEEVSQLLEVFDSTCYKSCEVLIRKAHLLRRGCSNARAPRTGTARLAPSTRVIEAERIPITAPCSLRTGLPLLPSLAAAASVSTEPPTLLTYPQETNGSRRSSAASAWAT